MHASHARKPSCTLGHVASSNIIAGSWKLFCFPEFPQTGRTSILAYFSFSDKVNGGWANKGPFKICKAEGAVLEVGLIEACEPVMTHCENKLCHGVI